MVGFERYGGIRGCLEYMQSRVLYSLGAYHHARQIDWMAVNRLVFVCKGNICRSPYAAERSRLLGVPAISYGLDATDGSPADAAAVRNARRRNIDLSQHRSNEFHNSGVQETDLITVFEPQQLFEIRRRIGNRAVSLTLLGIWASPISPYIQDPYGQNDRFFQRCYSAIDTYVLELIRRMKEISVGRREDQSRQCGQSKEHP